MDLQIQNWHGKFLCMKITDTSFKEIEKELVVQYGLNEKFDDNKVEINFLSPKKGPFPQRRFKNVKNYPYLAGIDYFTEFCHFKPNLPKESGVYLWVVNKEIIYIGEAKDLKSRFNSGYGNISPRNCFKGGQSTNVKMNQVALSYFKNGQTIEIYFIKTDKHKEIELYLLNRIKTPNNDKNN